MFSVYEVKTFIKPNDLDRIGSFHAWELSYEYNSLENIFTESLSKLKLHTCTAEEITKFGSTV
jgi:hypothetical protein